MQQCVGQTGDPEPLAEAERGAEGQGEGRRIDVTGNGGKLPVVGLLHSDAEPPGVRISCPANVFLSSTDNALRFDGVIESSVISRAFLLKPSGQSGNSTIEGLKSETTKPSALGKTLGDVTDNIRVR